MALVRNVLLLSSPADLPCLFQLHSNVNFLKMPAWIRYPRCNLSFAPLKAGSMCRGWSTTSNALYTVSDVVNGNIDIIGWKIILSENGEEIGEVEEIVQIGRYRTNSSSDGEVYQYLLKAVDFGKNSKEKSNAIEYLIPLVEAIISDINGEIRCLVIKPPDGLLALARSPEVLRRLRVSLSDFLKKMDGVNDREFRSLWMPTRRKLLAAGRKDLVDEIMRAGGFLHVAHALNLRARRRPDGFWEDLQNLDAEIEDFVKESLATRCDHSGIPNQLRKSRLMPRRRTVMEARRWDIHHAIVVHGGYKKVARKLGRTIVPDGSLSVLVQNIHKFMEEKGLSRYPTSQELRQGNRQDIILSIRNRGGSKALARHLGCEVVEVDYKYGRWKDISHAAAAIKSYMCAKLMEGKRQEVADVEQFWDTSVNREFLKLPTQAELEQEGRNDLRYVLQKFGHRKLASYLNVSMPSSRGRKCLRD